MNDVLSESELLRKCLNEGDGVVWELFVRRYAKLIWGALSKTFLSYSFRHTEEDLEDIFNAVFVSLLDNDFRKLRQFRNENSCSLSTWLTIIASRTAIDHMRQDRSHLYTETTEGGRDIYETIPASEKSFEHLIIEKQRDERLKAAIAQLGAQDRLIMRLVLEKGFSPEETAVIMGISAETVYSRKNRLAEKLKKSVGVV